jgi:diguanylate cyclase (GGDEF)-like protein
VSLVIFAMSLAAGIMLVIRFLRQRAFLLERELTRITQHDSLTGIYNRRYLTELAEREVTLARRHRRELSVLMLDIDHFKRINDTYGHDIGDRVIRAVTEACLAGVRSIDHVGRIGGEEFVCVLPETDAVAAQACAERLRRTIENSRLPPPNHGITFTVSVGVAVLKPAHQNWQALLKDADVALYRAKESGRNRVVTSTH